MGMASGCGEQEVGVVIRRYIDFLILLIPIPLVSVLFLQQHPYFLFNFFMFFVLVPELFLNYNFFAQYKHILATTGVPRQPYEGCTYCFIHEEAHTNVRFISCDGHQLYERGVDLEVEGVRYYRDASRAGRLRTGSASFNGQRSRIRRRSQCMPRRLRL